MNSLFENCDAEVYFILLCVWTLLKGTRFWLISDQRQSCPDQEQVFAPNLSKAQTVFHEAVPWERRIAEPKAV